MEKPISFPQRVESGDDLSRRVMNRLWQARTDEQNRHIIEDLTIAWFTVLYAAQGSPIPYVEATYRIFGCHPDFVFQRLTAWRKWKLGDEYSLWFDEFGNLRQNRFDIPDYDPTTGFHPKKEGFHGPY